MASEQPGDLPADKANVTILSRNAGMMLLSTLVACIFVLRTTVSTPDIQLLTNGGAAPLPVLNIGVSPPLFFAVGPLALLILSLITHRYLQRLWEAMSQLPAVFPDGTTVDEKTYPWLMNGLVRTGFLRLTRGKYAASLAGMQLLAFTLLAYGMVPLTLGIVFLRCLSRHDEPLSIWHTVVLATAAAGACRGYSRDRITLRRPLRCLVACLCGGCLLTLYVCNGVPLFLSAAQLAVVDQWGTPQDPPSDGRVADQFARQTRFALWRVGGGRFPWLQGLALSHYAEQAWAIPIWLLNPGSIVEDVMSGGDTGKPDPATTSAAVKPVSFAGRNLRFLQALAPSWSMPTFAGQI